MTNILKKMICGLIWQLGWFGTLQSTRTGCGNDLPTLLTNQDFQHLRQCLSENIWFEVILDFSLSFMFRPKCYYQNGRMDRGIISRFLKEYGFSE